MGRIMVLVQLEIEIESAVITRCLLEHTEFMGLREDMKVLGLKGENSAQS
jgi:hypothetical protein